MPTASSPAEVFEDDISWSTGVATLPISNVRRVTLSPNNMNRRNEENDHVLRGIVAEMIWLASVGIDDGKSATTRSKKLLKILIIKLDDSDELEINEIYHAICAVGGDVPKFLRGNFMVTVMEVVNAFDQTTQSYAQRGNLLSLMRRLAEPDPTPPTTPTPSTIAVGSVDNTSDLTCHNEGVTALAGETRTMVRNQHPAGLDLAAMAGGLDEASFNQNVVGGPPVGFLLSEESSIVQGFCQGDYAALRASHEPDQLIAALAANVDTLRALLWPSNAEENHTTSGNVSVSLQTRGGNTNDFSRGEEVN